MKIDNTILHELQALRNAQDEPDFMHSITDAVYKYTESLIKEAYEQIITPLPTPAVAPDGIGGLVIEWKQEYLTVRLIVQPDNKYIYNNDGKRGFVTHDTHSTVLANTLQSLFTNEFP